MLKELKNKKFWMKSIVLAAVVVFATPIISNLLSSILNLGDLWNQFTSVLITVMSTELLYDKIFK